MKGKLPGILAIITSVVGLVSSPMVLGLIPPHWAAVIVAAGVLWQSVTDALHKS